MDENILYRKLALGFENSLSNEKRDLYFSSDIEIEEIFKSIDKKQDIISIEQSLRWLEKEENHVMFHDDDMYPVYEPVSNRIPYMLFYKGEKPVNRFNISIVGTRFPEGLALHEAFRLGFECCINGIGVVTGLAEGIDQAAARGGVTAYNFSGFSRVIAVMGCGLEYDYPRCTSGLKRRIVDCGGSLVSQFAPYMPPYKQNFPNRNVTLAAYGALLIVVQAPRHSGSLITSDFALQMGKDVVVSQQGARNVRTSLGSYSLCEDGASVINHISDIADVKYIIEDTDNPVIPFTRYCDKFYNIIMNKEIIE